jgi:hypothetical protein
MQTLFIEVERQETVKQEVELSIPAYFKSEGGSLAVAIIDEKTVVELTNDNYEKKVRTYNNEAWNAGKDLLVHAYNKYHSCTESEFVEMYDDVMQSIYSHKKLAV